MVAMTIPYKPSSGDKLLYMPINTPCKLGVGAPGAIGKLYALGLIQTQLIIYIYKNVTQVGTITCPINTYDFVFNISSDVNLSIGDILEFRMGDMSGVIDGNIKGFGITFNLVPV